MAPFLAGTCMLICLTAIYFSLRVLADSRKMKKKVEDKETPFRP